MCKIRIATRTGFFCPLNIYPSFQNGDIYVFPSLQNKKKGILDVNDEQNRVDRHIKIKTQDNEPLKRWNARRIVSSVHATDF